MKKMMKVLQEYEMESGHMINLDKSLFIFMKRHQRECAIKLRDNRHKTRQFSIYIPWLPYILS